MSDTKNLTFFYENYLVNNSSVVNEQEIDESIVTDLNLFNECVCKINICLCQSCFL